MTSKLNPPEERKNELAGNTALERARTVSIGIGKDTLRTSEKFTEDALRPRRRRTAAIARSFTSTPRELPGRGSEIVRGWRPPQKPNDYHGLL